VCMKSLTYIGSPSYVAPCTRVTGWVHATPAMARKRNAILWGESGPGIANQTPRIKRGHEERSILRRVERVQEVAYACGEAKPPSSIHAQAEFSEEHGVLLPANDGDICTKETLKAPSKPRNGAKMQQRCYRACKRIQTTKPPHAL
jgi:hypothetical protein